MMFDRATLEEAQAVIRPVVPPTPLHAWPLLAGRAGCAVHVKHENHTPTGAFKVRGGLFYMDRLVRRDPAVRGVVTATRGNHGQSIALAAKRHGRTATILVPHGNSVEKNAAMRAFGAELIEHGRDFDEAREEAARLAVTRGLHPVPSFDPDLVAGVATYALEMFEALADIDTVYVPIGMGSGICGVVTVRDLLGLSTEVVGVVSDRFPIHARAFAGGEAVTTGPATTIADGMAVRAADPRALAIVKAGVARIVQVSDEEIALAMRAYYTDTHNLAEGAGAAPLAALLQEKAVMAGRRVAVILCGGNVDLAWFRRYVL